MPFCFGKLMKRAPSATININECVFTYITWTSICQVVSLTLTLFALGFKIHLGRSDHKWNLSHLSLYMLCHFCKHTAYMGLSRCLRTGCTQPSVRPMLTKTTSMSCSDVFSCNVLVRGTSSWQKDVWSKTSQTTSATDFSWWSFTLAFSTVGSHKTHFKTKCTEVYVSLSSLIWYF